ncbi:MAG TPA: arginase family protein [Tissierellales bacterium]|nr:arginase family protein [Tissierellales bacterium]
MHERLKRRKNKGITFIGSGNYHYVTYLLMSEIKIPFTLILFDHHTDMIKPIHESILSCGSWVLEAIDSISMLKKVIIIGVRKDLTEAIPSCLNMKVSTVLKDEILQGNVLENEKIKKDIISKIPTSNVYISIDKDVLCNSDVLVNWDQGSMRLRQLMDIVQHINKYKNIYGVDVCGEYTFNPAEAFLLKSLKAKEMNNKANSMILKELIKNNQ